MSLCCKAHALNPEPAVVDMRRFVVVVYCSTADRQPWCTCTQSLFVLTLSNPAASLTHYSSLLPGLAVLRRCSS